MISDRVIIMIGEITSSCGEQEKKSEKEEGREKKKKRRGATRGEANEES